MLRHALAPLVLAATPAWANDAIFLAAVPTLDEVGLGALIAAVAAAAGWAVRRRRRR